MATIYHQVGIKGSTDSVFSALTTIEGLAQWWTSDTRGDPGSGGNLDFYFNEFKMSMEVLTVQNNARVHWRCTAGDTQWVDTEIEFVLRDDGKQILVDFSHGGWAEASDLFRHCSTKWAVFLLSLKNLVETGDGQAFPDDLHINYF